METLTQDILREMFDYQDGQLINRFTRGPRAVKGSVAGGINSTTGYWRVSINKKFYQLSRLIWLWHHGELDDKKHVDHLDGDINNNRIENLRLCTPAQNEWNKPCKGVSFEKGKWRARLRVNGKNIHIGLFNSEIEAQKARSHAALSLRGEITQRKAA